MLKQNKYLKFLLGFIVFSFSFLEGSDIIDRRFGVSFNLNIILFILGISLIGGLIYTYYENKSEKTVKKEITQKESKKKYAVYLNIGLTLLIIILFYFYYNKGENDKRILKEILPSIHEAYEKGDINFVYTETKDILSASPENTVVESYYNKVTTIVDIYSSPSNIELYFKFPKDTLHDWIFLGNTPL